MPRFKLAVLVGLTFAAATAGAQQDVTVHLTAPNAPGGGAVTAFGYYMSPYSGTVDGSTERLNCVDFFHEVTIGETWTAVQVNLGAAIANNNLLSSTRDGSNGLLTLSEALDTYEQVAWLTAQMPSDPATNSNEATAIQTAIWDLASNAPGQLYSSQDLFWDGGKVSTAIDDGVKSTGYWIDQAAGQYANYGASYYSNFNIVTDANINQACTNDPALRYTCTAQEFMYATPEPGTTALVATGLLAIIGVGVRRRRIAFAV